MKRICTLIVVIAVCVGAAGVSHTATSSSSKARQYQSQLRSVSGKIKTVKAKIAATRKKQKVAASKLFQTQQQLNKTRTDLGYTRKRLTRARGELTGINYDLRRAEKKLSDKRSHLTRRLEDAYKNPAPSYIMAVLSAEDSWSAMTRAKMIQQVVTSDLELLQDIREVREDVRRRQAAQRRKVSEINSIQADLAGQETSEKQLAWQHRSELKEIIADRAQYERALDALLAESYRVAARIRALQSTPAGRKRYATAFRGGFIRPVSGRISSGYGMRFHPILKKTKMHTGVDISARSGTSIKAAASGTVIIAGWMGAYGNAVVIDHGGGVSTLYGHCSALSVRSGQQVKQGATVGRVGSTGWSTGPHLHFEVRKNGQPVSPM